MADEVANVAEDEVVELDDEQTQKNEPVDIAEAFRMYNASQRKTAQNLVEDGEESTGEPEEPADTSGGEEGDLVEETGDTGDELGDDTNVIEPVDLSPQKQDYLKRIQSQAIANVRKQMENDNIELWTMDDIYERDEETGRVTFNNPDDPMHPFQNRAEAQNFLNAMNQEVTNYFRNQVNKEQQKLVQQQAPVLQMFDFAPVYQAMNTVEQGIFNDLIEPYAIQDQAGNVIGFNTNLQSVANTARQIAKRFGNSTPSETDNNTKNPKQKIGSKPAMDMKTGASQGGVNEEPKTLGEALKMYDQQQREMNKKGK